MATDNAKYIEYSKGAVPELNNIPPCSFHYKNIIKTPNLFAEYLTLRKNQLIYDNLKCATSHEYFVLEGSGKTIIKSSPENIITWNKGDVFILPYETNDVVHLSFEDNTIIFTANDSPILEYLNCKPICPKFLPTHFLNSDIMKKLNNLRCDPEVNSKNRNGILLTTDHMMKEKLNTLTHTMWSLYNFIPPNTIQPPHRHNSVAIDLCVDIDEETSNKGLIYTLMGKKLDENNKILNPIKMVWKKHHSFVTPPGWWHSHHNESDTTAYVFPVQDAGLHTYMETLDISFI
tara:strand:+ start:5476 stop:6342 length:867 start_codon:yes stop_codon:yes gene_type:complete